MRLFFAKHFGGMLWRSSLPTFLALKEAHQRALYPRYCPAIAPSGQFRDMQAGPGNAAAPDWLGVGQQYRP